MPLDLNQLLKKAKDRGIDPSVNNLNKTWYQESTITKADQKNNNIHKPDTNLTQTEHKVNTKPDTIFTNISVSINKLDGIQKKLIKFVYEHCKMNADGVTPHLGLEYISVSNNIKKGSIKTSIQRLIKKGLLKKIDFKDGRSGWVQLMLEPPVYRELFHLAEIDLSHISFNKFIKPNTKLDTKLDTSLNSSSSLDLNHNTTDYSNSDIEYEFNLEPLAGIGLSETHVKQLIKHGKLTAEEIQESINHFAFDLVHNDKAKTIKTNALAFFMGTLKKGDYYNPPSNYESQKARNLRLSLEAKAQREQIEKELEEKLKEVEWKEWSEKLTDQELLEFYVEDKPLDGVPDKVQKTLKRRNALTNAREYFESEVWPKQKGMIGDSNYA